MARGGRPRPTPTRARSSPSARTDRLVTEGVLRDGRGFYTSSDRTGEHWATVLLVGEPDQAGALNLVAASIRPGQPLPWDLPEDGRLVRLVTRGRGLRGQRRLGGPPSRGAAARPVAPAPAPAPASTSAAETW